MPDITIIRGDSYAVRRPIYTYVLVDDEGQPFNLAGCTVRTTLKTEITPVDTDPNDDMAIIKHQMDVDTNGIETFNDGLYLLGAASQGVITERLTYVETKMFQPNVTYYSDIQLTDASGEIFTWTWNDGLRAADSVTNRDM